jgi:hypothetical protein
VDDCDVIDLTKDSGGQWRTPDMCATESIGRESSECKERQGIGDICKC